MSVQKIKFGELDNKEIYCFKMEKGDLKAEILNYGGIIKSLTYKGVDVVLGRDTLEEYLDNGEYFGAIIGRNSNRIENSCFEISGKEYKLFSNDGRNNLHGGKCGFDKKVWDCTESDRETKLTLSYTSPDGEEGYPGNAKVTVTYSVTEENSIAITYEAECDCDTVMNLTNHSYFNLNGHDSGSVEGHAVTVKSSFFTPNTDECIPYGEILSVKGTPFDFSTGETLGSRISSDYEQIRMFDGFDHNIVLDGSGYRNVAEIAGDKTGIKMQIFTDLPAIQLYTGNGIKGDRACKDGAVYKKHGGMCLETQVYPNNLRYSHFPTSILRKGEKYFTQTEYKFI